MNSTIHQISKMCFQISINIGKLKKKKNLRKEVKK